MKITILGSGAWEGIPAPFCQCRVCKLAKDNVYTKDFRTRPQILVETKKGKFLIEISPDIRIQTSRFNLEQIDTFLVSHWHFDHLYGLLELHAWSEFVSDKKTRIFCSQKTKDWLDVNFGHIRKEIFVLKPFEKFKLQGVQITPIPVYHMYLADKLEKEEELENTFGFILEKNRKKIVYLSDYYACPNKTLNKIKNADVIIADGTYLFEEYFPNNKLQKHLKKDRDHLHGEQIFDFIKKTKAKKIVFHSISHLSRKTHEELQKLLPKNMFISYDGMELKM